MVAGGDRRSPTAALTVGEVLERWFEHAMPQLSPSTVETTRVVLDAHLLPYVAELPLAKLTAPKVDALYAQLRAQGGRGGRPLSSSTVQRAHNILHRALAQAVRWGWVAANPVGAATPPRRATQELRPPSPDEVARIIEVARDWAPALAVYLLVAAATGARRGELVALRWSDVDLEAARLTIARSIVHTGGGLVEKDTKNHSARRIALDPQTVAALRLHRDAGLALAERCDTELAARAFVFSNAPDGAEPWRPDYLTHAFARVAAKAGVPHVRLHDLRHFVATRLLTGGIDVRTVAGRLGHRNPNVTLNVYSAFLPEADREAAHVMGRLLHRDEEPSFEADIAT